MRFLAAGHLLLLRRLTESSANRLPPFFPPLQLQTNFHHLLKLNLKGVDAVRGKQHLPEAPHDVQAGQAGLALHPRDQRPATDMRELRPIPVAAVHNPLTKVGLRLDQLLSHLIWSYCQGKGGNKDGKEEGDACHI